MGPLKFCTKSIAWERLPWHILSFLLLTLSSKPDIHWHVKLPGVLKHSEVLGLQLCRSLSHSFKSIYVQQRNKFTIDIAWCTQMPINQTYLCNFHHLKIHIQACICSQNLSLSIHTMLPFWMKRICLCLTFIYVCCQETAKIYVYINLQWNI